LAANYARTISAGLLPQARERLSDSVVAALSRAGPWHSCTPRLGAHEFTRTLQSALSSGLADIALLPYRSNTK